MLLGTKLYSLKFSFFNSVYVRCKTSLNKYLNKLLIFNFVYKHVCPTAPTTTQATKKSGEASSKYSILNFINVFIKQ